MGYPVSGGCQIRLLAEGGGDSCIGAVVPGAAGLKLLTTAHQFLSSTGEIQRDSDVVHVCGDLPGNVNLGDLDQFHFPENDIALITLAAEMIAHVSPGIAALGDFDGFAAESDFEDHKIRRVCAIIDGSIANAEVPPGKWAFIKFTKGERPYRLFDVFMLHESERRICERGNSGSAILWEHNGSRKICGLFTHVSGNKFMGQYAGFALKLTRERIERLGGLGIDLTAAH